MTHLQPIDKLRTLMSTGLPECFDPIRLCQLKAVMQGMVSINEFEKLNGLLFNDSGFVSVRLEFFNDEHNRAVIAGCYQGGLNLICQRCLGEIQFRLDIQPLMAVITDLDQAETLPKKYDPLLFQNEMINTKEIIEEELLLAVPMVPRCNTDSCIDNRFPTSEEKKTDTSRPFYGLNKLINKQE